MVAQQTEESLKLSAAVRLTASPRNLVHCTDREDVEHMRERTHPIVVKGDICWLCSGHTVEFLYFHTKHKSIWTVMGH